MIIVIAVVIMTEKMNVRNEKPQPFRLNVYEVMLINNKTEVKFAE